MDIAYTRNVGAPLADSQVPRNTSGDRYRWACLLPGGETWAWADDLSVLVAVLMGNPEYLTMCENAKREARIMYAVSRATWTQGLINAHAQEVGDWSLLAQWETAALMQSKDTPPNAEGFPTRRLEGFNGVDVWTAPVPLVVVTGNHFAGGRNNVPEIISSDPRGETVWDIDPNDEARLLASLDQCDDIRLAVRNYTPRE